MKRWLTCLLIMLFSVQALPLHELGKRMLKKSSTEQSSSKGDNTEDPAGDDTDGKVKGEESAKYLAGSFSADSLQRIHSLQLQAYFHSHSRIPAAHHFEVVTPPPDYRA